MSTASSLVTPVCDVTVHVPGVWPVISRRRSASAGVSTSATFSSRRPLEPHLHAGLEMPS